MIKNDKQEKQLPENITPLTFEVAKQYLEKEYWSQHEAVMLISGHNPSCYPFYDDDDANEYWLARLVWQGVRHFYPSGKRLTVASWLEWITNGSNDHPRSNPIGFGPELKNALSKSKSGMQSLQKALSVAKEEVLIRVPEIKVKGAWRSKVQEAAFFNWCKSYGAGSNPSVHSISSEMARWCIENNVKNDYNGHPSAGTIRNSVLDAKSWEPPSMTREKAKQFVLDAISTAQVAQVAQVPK
jgi:hypothetical protein